MTRAPHRLARWRTWILLVVVVVLLAGHIVVVYHVSSHVAIWVVILSAAIVVLVIKHWARPGRMHALFRRRSRNAREMDHEYREG